MQILMYDVYGLGILTSLRNERGRKVIEIAKLHVFYGIVKRPWSITVLCTLISLKMC